jgi:hypothetical protein
VLWPHDPPVHESIVVGLVVGAVAAVDDGVRLERELEAASRTVLPGDQRLK